MDLFILTNGEEIKGMGMEGRSEPTDGRRTMEKYRNEYLAGMQVGSG